MSDFAQRDLPAIREEIERLEKVQYAVRRQLLYQTLAKIRRVAKLHPNVVKHEKAFEAANKAGTRQVANEELDILERMLSIDC